MSFRCSPLATEIRATLAVAAPLAAANLAQVAMGVTNTVMVGHLGAAGLAAAGLGAGINITLFIVCQGVLTAVAPLAAHAIGADDRHAAGRVAAAGLFLALLLAVPAVAVLTWMPHLLAVLGYGPDLVGEIARYLLTVRWGVPAMLSCTVVRLLLIAAFRARIVMAVPLFAVPLNAALGWGLIFGHLGLPVLGITGAAATTALVQWLMLIGLGGYMLLLPLPVRIAGRFLRELPRIIRLGAPISALAGLESGLFITAGILAGLLGADALGAHQLALNIASITFQVPLGLSQAAMVRVAFHLGTGGPAAARRAAFVAPSLAAMFMLAMAALLWTAPRTLAGLYVDLGDPGNRALVAIALRLLAVAAVFQVFDGVQVAAAGALRGYRDTTVPMIVAAVGYWPIGFAGGWLLAFPFGFGAVGLWIGMALGLAVVAASLTLRLHFCARAAVPHSEPQLQTA